MAGSRVHPETCRCRTCKKKRRENKHEFRFVMSSMWVVVFLLLAFF